MHRSQLPPESPADPDLLSGTRRGLRSNPDLLSGYLGRLLGVSPSSSIEERQPTWMQQSGRGPGAVRTRARASEEARVPIY